MSYLINFDTRELPQVDCEYLILGSGIAGLYTALRASRMGGEVTLLTKQTMIDTNTDKAQGGIAAALGDSDSPDLHREDTLMAGGGLCDQDAVTVLVTEGPDRVRELIEIGAVFDCDDNGLALTREGAHSQRRILHASGDATGAEIQRVLTQSVRRDPDIRVLENHYVIDLLVKGSTCYGALAFDQQRGETVVFHSKVVVLATGGLGRLFEHNTNPEVATGDGVAMAFRAGAEIMDIEFIQFHPTVLALPGAPRFLISEAVRGEGAYLRNSSGARFMPRFHELAELAPRDVVVRAILEEMAATGSNEIYLDLTHLEPAMVRSRFPNITRTCADHGLDITVDLIPVAPAAHYVMGGVKTNLHGETNVEKLFACGEVACAGVHGANRLASNSLLDGLVFGGRIVECAQRYLRNCSGARPEFVCDWLLEAEKVDFYAIRKELETVMSRKVGPVRNAKSLTEALDFFERWSYLSSHQVETTDRMEVMNMLQVGELIAGAALMRTESRGGHFRTDYPEPRRRWQKHIILRR